MSSEAMSYDVVIVGAGPAGLSAAIHLKRLDASIQVCVLEKGSEVGAHILSGNVFDPRALDELLPDWQEQGAPLTTPATQDAFYLLTKAKKWRLPTPPQMRNKGNYIISLADLCRWLARQAESLGVEIYPGFSAVEILKDAQNRVIGAKTGDLGRDRENQPTDLYQAGIEIFAKQLLLAEGCRGSLTETIIKDYQLRSQECFQTYGLGLKEIWQVEAQHHRLGYVEHTIGWPLDPYTYGGSFIYHAAEQQVHIGYVVGLDYQNPYLSPFEEFQRFKQHPAIRPMLESGQRIAYGARALNEGGWQSLPKLVFPGGAIIGCAAGFLNVPKIKGAHTAMKSGMLAAEGVVQYLATGTNDYTTRFERSWVAQELKRVRNIRPGFKWGLIPGMMNAAFETLTQGRVPWTLKHARPDHTSLKQAQYCHPPSYAKPDGVVSFDRLSSVYLTHIQHTEHQPNHLILKNPEQAIQHNYALYQSPEQYYCPAHVYEVIQPSEKETPYLQINSANCIHCKTCDIKDPTQNIHWVPPEGGSGPNYGNM